MKNNVLKLFNTQTRKKEDIEPYDKKCMRIYTCGPTIYDFAHIGNFRTYVFEDLLRRTLKYFKYDIKQVMNITDVDDKTIKGALKNHKSLSEYVTPFKLAFFEDLEKLNIEKAEFYPEATHYIKEMIDIISDLLEKNIAYKGSDGSIYFSIGKFPSYGKLSHLKMDDLIKGASERVSLDEYDKENASDFVLWKAYDEKRDGNIFWESPFGKGRPGWHIECSAMAIKLLGTPIDIHCGGVDNIFPHHENEIAQSESFTGKPFVLHWAHSEHLIVDGKKMSKSLNNFYTLRNLLDKGYSGREVRFALLQSHYRQQLNFTMEGLDSSRKSLKRISDFKERLNEISSLTDHNFISSLIEKAKKEFNLSLSDDLNISQALAALFDFIREVNQLSDNEKISKKEAQTALHFLKEIDSVLGIIFYEEKIDIPENVKEAFDKRQIARKDKDFKKSDELRDYIFQQGFIIEDGKDGAKLKKK